MEGIDGFNSANAKSPGTDTQAITSYKQHDGADEQHMVRIERFGQVLDWVGPCSDKMLERVQEMVSKKWFHGDISAPEAESLLQDLPPGTFLVRFSSTMKGALALSMVQDGGGFAHQRMRHVPEGYLYNNSSYESMMELIVANAQKQNLRYAAPGSKFQTLFTNATAPYSNYQEPTH